MAILGLAYKPLSHVVEESPGVAIAGLLAKCGLAVSAFDPLAADEARRALGDQVHIADALPDAVRDADAVVVATPDPVFGGLSASDILGARARITVIDCWRVTETALSDADGIEYIPVGHCVEEERAFQDMLKLWQAPGAETDPPASSAKSNPTQSHSVAST